MTRVLCCYRTQVCNSRYFLLMTSSATFKRYNYSEQVNLIHSYKMCGLRAGRVQFKIFWQNQVYDLASSGLKILRFKRERWTNLPIVNKTARPPGVFFGGTIFYKSNRFLSTQTKFYYCIIGLQVNIPPKILYKYVYVYAYMRIC